MKNRWRWQWWGLGSVIVLWLILIISTPWPADVLVRPLVINEPLQSADVIIVLGAGTRANPPRLPPQAMDRLKKAYEIWDRDLAPQVIVAGGYSRRVDNPETKYMKPYLESLGVPEDDILEENQSLDTYQNAVNSLRLMDDHGWGNAIVVTSSYHTWRGCHIFRALNADVICVAAPLDDHHSVYERLLNMRSIFREYGAIVYYWLGGKL